MSQKTLPVPGSARDLIAALEPGRRRDNGLLALEVFERATGQRAEIWSNGIIGFGRMTYRYSTGTTGIWMRVGFASRASELVLYGLQGFPEAEALLEALGKHRKGKGCVYVRNLAAADATALNALIERGFAHVPDYEVAE